jgi:uncharacterized phage infection (PIP) family protein YhgE
VVAFAERPATAADRNASALPEPSGDGLERELGPLRASGCRPRFDELETANEELKSSNEEYQSVNEELQSTNEELETSKEEMQSINAELQTVNSELNSKNDQLMRTVSDLTNLKNSTQIATITIDRALHIRDFTPPTNGPMPSTVISLRQTASSQRGSEASTYGPAANRAPLKLWLEIPRL